MRKIPVLLCLLASCSLSFAQVPFFQFQRQQRPGKTVTLEWDTDFHYFFDNREFAASNDWYSASETVHGAVLTPSIGFSVAQGSSARHRIMAGLDLTRNMGAGEENLGLVRELTFYYDVHAKKEGAAFEAVAGCFPRAYLEGEYGRAFFDDKYLLLDRNLEGLLLKYRSRSFLTELSLDWMGVTGATSHERFQILSYGHWDALDWLSLGWSGSFYHYACSQASPGVVDNHLLEPFFRLDFGEAAGLDELSLKGAFLWSYQWDRKQSPLACPMGGEATFRARFKSLGVDNSFFAGEDMQPLWSATDLSGAKYGSDLYFGCPMYQAGLFDRAELFWRPSLTPYLDLSLSAVFWFGRAYLGCQQMCSLLFNLDALRNPACISGRVGKPAGKKSPVPSRRMSL